MAEYGLIGKNILGSGFSFEIKIKEGAGAFVCGEETSLIHSIEGKRGMPRTRPPFPAVSGLHGKPTVINNVKPWARSRISSATDGAGTGSLAQKLTRAPRLSRWSARSGGPALSKFHWGLP